MNKYCECLFFNDRVHKLVLKTHQKKQILEIFSEMLCRFFCCEMKSNEVFENENAMQCNAMVQFVFISHMDAVTESSQCTDDSDISDVHTQCYLYLYVCNMLTKQMNEHHNGDAFDMYACPRERVCSLCVCATNLR